METKRNSSDGRYDPGRDGGLNGAVGSRDRPKTNRVTPITQRDVDLVIESVECVVENYERCSRMDENVKARVERLQDELNTVRKSRNIHLAHTVILEVIEWGLDEMTWLLLTIEGSNDRNREQEKEIARLEAEVEHLQQIVWQPQGAVTLPEHTIKVHSRIQTVILRLMAGEGLARSWRVQQRVIETGLTQSENSVRNGLRKLDGKGLVSNYRWNGRAVGWSPVPGGRRRLVTLTERGRAWCRRVFGDEPVESEVTPMAKKHNSVAHAVGILEARDHLRARGYRVDDSPDPILVEKGQRWGRRAEPDLMVEMDGHAWPVEVQREVSPRYTTKKWDKVLGLTGRLALILFNEKKRSQQEDILIDASDDLPAGEIKLISLEGMEGKLSGWTTIPTVGDR